jgi:chloramphenicol O-acetyltransferase
MSGWPSFSFTKLSAVAGSSKNRTCLWVQPFVNEGQFSSTDGTNLG